MSFDWRKLPPEEMEKHFNPRVTVPDPDARIARFAERSADARNRIPGRYDIRYGERAKETLDLHQPPGVTGADAGARPMVLFIHGGFWRGLDKNDHSFVVPPLLDTGAVVANVNYDLCPDVTLDTIVDEIANAVVFCHRNAQAWGADPNAMYLVGHSAGAHLGAEMMLHRFESSELPPDALRGVAALTGVYEPEVVLSVTVNEEARIDEATAIARSCLDRTFLRSPKVLIAAGGDEPTGWIAQSEAFHGACRAQGLDATFEVVPGANHFTLLERAISAGDPLYDSMVGLWT